MLPFHNTTPVTDHSHEKTSYGMSLPLMGMPLAQHSET